MQVHPLPAKPLEPSGIAEERSPEAKPFLPDEAERRCLKALAPQPISIRRLACASRLPRRKVVGALDRLRAADLVRVVQGTSGPSQIHRLTPRGQSLVALIEEFEFRALALLRADEAGRTPSGLGGFRLGEFDARDDAASAALLLARP